MCISLHGTTHDAADHNGSFCVQPNMEISYMPKDLVNHDRDNDLTLGGVTTRPLEEQRPVLTIVILVAGVVGGLVVVITVVYFYRFCLKKRPPVTTTGKPEHKRDQIRSQAASQCRPLPLPPVIAKPSFSVPSHYQSCMPQLEPTSLQSPDKRTAINIGEPDSADKTAKLFPSNFSVTVTTAVGEKKEPPSYKNDRSNQAKGMHFIVFEFSRNYLTVDGIPPRPQSAETMLRVAEDEERRRASLDAYHRHIRRQLPNIEHLEQVSELNIPKVDHVAFEEDYAIIV
uniref:Cadherin_C domain-containing protein n=1 Tax=Ascaris lumbricoides TaxID=6252 RepID=A0A0M3I2C7_ASCLU